MENDNDDNEDEKVTLEFLGLSGYPFHSPNLARLADILGMMMEW